MEKLTTDGLDDLMLSKTNNTMISGTVYLYDKYAKPESEKVKLHYRQIAFQLIESLLKRRLTYEEQEEINGYDICYTYLVYRDNEDINPEDETNLLKYFKKILPDSFKTKFKNCVSCRCIQLINDTSDLDANIFVFLAKMEEEKKDEEVQTAMDK